MANLELSPTTTFIDVTWELDSPSGDVDEYKVTYAGHSGGHEAYCFTVKTSTVDSDCNEDIIFLAPCTGYDITVQPLDRRDEIGTPATVFNYTLPGNKEI